MTKLLILLGLPLVATVAGAVDLDSLFVRSVGGLDARDSLGQVSTYRAEGTVLFNGQQGRFVEILAVPHRFYLKITLGDLELVQAFDGETAWQQDHNGRISQLQGYERRELMRTLYFETYSFVFQDRLEGDARYLGDTTSDGRAYHQVAVYPLNRDTVTLLFDRETGLRRYLLSRLDNLLSISELRDYRMVAGFLIPHHLRTRIIGAPLSTEFTIEDVAIDGEIDPSIFAMSSASVVDYRFDGRSTSVRVPFEYKHGHIWLPATINGTREVWFILDSGTSANMFHRDIVHRLGLQTVGSLPAKGLASYDEVALVRSDSLTIGSLTLLGQVAGSLDLSVFGRHLGENQILGGILGHDFLSRFPMIVDYHDSALIVYDPETFVAPEGGSSVDFRLAMLVPTVTAELNGIPGEFLVDLGNAYGLILHRGFVERYQLTEKLSDVRSNPAHLAGVRGVIGGKTAYAASFRIGDILLQSLRVMLPDSGDGLTGSSEFAGNIGNLILENFRVLFDYENSRLTLYDADNR